ncbi:MAG: FAD-dependent monooxygenase [Planctomycetes bacterium]|nr:FAD-dependent monooxygenase [Planctomycetota bacterium]
MSAAPHVAIAGAGLAGALLACYLGRRGYRVDLYERRPDPRAAGFVGGRSINLALSARGLDALERVGLAEKVLADAIPMRGRMMHSVRGRLTFQPYSKNTDEAINSVSRGNLNVTLLEAADEYESVTLHFDHQAVDADLDAGTCALVGPGGERVAVTADLIVGCDGAFSAIRARMQKTERFSYSQSYLAHGYKELTIPPAKDGSFAMEPNALHIWPRGGSMMIALPNADRTFTCTCFWPFEGPNGFDVVGTDAEIVHRFDRDFRDAVPLMPTLVEDYRKNPVGSLVTIRCDPWHHDDRFLLLGDAAHAVVPFYGQGANAAFEDCVALDALIERHGPDWATVLPRLSTGRKADADAIADMAIANFIEMRDKVGSRSFLLRKKTEKLLHRWLSRWYTPLYNLVSFSTIPYAAARRRARRQDRVLVAAGLGALAVIVVAVAALVHWLRR